MKFSSILAWATIVMLLETTVKVGDIAKAAFKCDFGYGVIGLHQ